MQYAAAFDGSALSKVLNPVVTEIIYPLLYIVFALAVFIFIYGVIEMIAKGSAEARETGRRHIIYGVIGLFIMISAWGIVNFISNSIKEFSNNASHPSTQPQVQWQNNPQTAP